MGNKKKVRAPHLRLVGKPDRRLTVDQNGLVNIVKVPSDEKVIVKEVPARVDSVDVGVAYIFQDGSVEVSINEDAPDWAIAKIKGTAAEVGYSLPEGM